MQGPIFFLIFALTLQYISDFVFLYQANHGTWHVGRIDDLLYCVSYLLMTLGVIYVGEVSKKVKEMSILGDRVVFTSSADDFAVVIENPELADALKKAFNQSAKLLSP